MRAFSKSLMARALVAMAVLSAGALAARAGDMDPALSQIPANAQFVVLVRSLGALQTKVSNLAVQLQLPAPADLIGTFAPMIGINKGIDLNGSAALVKIAPATPAPGADAAPQSTNFLLLIPTTDPKALLEKFKPSDPVDGISTVTIPNQSNAGYVAVSTDGKYVIMADNKDSLASFLAGVKAKPIAAALPSDALGLFDKNDIIFYSDLAGVHDTLLHSIDGYVDMMQGLIAMTQAHGGTAPTALNKAMMDVEFAELRNMISDGTWTGTGVRLENGGLAITESMHFKPTSKYALLCKNQMALTAPDLSLLPNGEFMLAGSASVDPQSLQNWGQDISHEFLSDKAIAGSAQLPEYKKLAATMVSTWGQISGLKGVFLTQPQASKGLVNGVMLVDSKDPDGYIKDAVATAKQMGATQTNPLVKITVTATDNAVTVQGVNFTKIAMKFEKGEAAGADDTAATLMANEMGVMMGQGNTLNEYMGSVNGRVMVVVGNDPATIDAALTALMTKDTKLAQNQQIAEVDKITLANPVARAYLPIMTWIETAKRYRGAPAAAPAAGALSVGGAALPAVASLKTSEDGATAELYLPRQTLISVVEEAKQLYGSMGGQ